MMPRFDDKASFHTDGITGVHIMVPAQRLEELLQYLSLAQYHTVAPNDVQVEGRSYKVVNLGKEPDNGDDTQSSLQLQHN